MYPPPLLIKSLVAIVENVEFVTFLKIDSLFPAWGTVRHFFNYVFNGHHVFTGQI